MIFTFCLGGGLAIAALYLSAGPERIPLLASTLIILIAAWLGARIVFAIPLDLRANWLFRVAPTPNGPQHLIAIRRALLMVAVFPVLAIAAALGLWQHFLILAFLGSILTDLSLRNFQKIPFTCSWLPGKSKIHIVFWFAIFPLIAVVHEIAAREQSALIPILAVAAIAARRISGASPDIHFEDTRSDELVMLGLNR